MALMFEFIEILYHIRNGDGTEFGANSFYGCPGSSVDHRKSSCTLQQ